MTDKALDVLVIGGGMYTSGRGTDGFGTLLPALFQAQRDEELVGSITVTTTSRGSAAAVAEKAAGLAGVLGRGPRLTVLPADTDDPDTWRSVLRERGRDLDCAIVATPDPLHYEMAKECLEAELHTLVVKPFVTRLEDGIDLVKRAEARGRVGMVEFHKRWDRANLELREAVRSGAIGDPLYFHVDFSQRKCIPETAFRKWVADTDVFQYLGVHYVDMVYFVCGRLPRRVLCTGQKKWLTAQGLDTWDSTQTLVEWEGGFTSVHLTNWIDPDGTSSMSEQYIKVVGTRGRLASDQKNRGIELVTDAGGAEQMNPYFSRLDVEGPDGARFEGYGSQSVRAFLNDVRDVAAGRVTPAGLEMRRPTFRAALVSTAVLDAAHESLAADGAWVHVAPELAEWVG